MTETLRDVAATIKHDGKVYELRQGAIPAGTPKAVVDELRERGSLTTAEAPAAFEIRGEVGDPDPALSPGKSSDEMPDGAPDVATADVATIAAFIDTHNLTAPQTVALAGESPEGARKVLEAEKVANGGDPRATVAKPLSKLAGG